MIPSSPLTVTTARLTIRRFRRDDLEDLLAYRSDPEVARYQDWDADWSLPDAERFLPNADEPPLGEPGAWTQLAITERGSGRLLGDIGVHVVADQPATIELGVTLASHAQARGLATEGVAGVVAWLFEEHTVHRVFANVDARNRPARSLLSSLGFRQEAELRRADWFKGEWTTLCTYAVLASEWCGNPEPEPAEPEPTRYVEPTNENGRRLFERGVDGPVMMLNLLRFRETADYSQYPDLAPADPISGRTAYDRYIAHTMPFLVEAGGTLEFLGKGGSNLIGPEDERWDLVMLVRHRSVAALMGMADHDAYLAGIGHRVAAVEDSRLLPIEEIGRL